MGASFEYLPFSDYADLVDARVCGYDSIAISGHKFFGIDELIEDLKAES